jgi:CTP:phosphocholine cytidylyltransferase-like protein
MMDQTNTPKNVAVNQNGDVTKVKVSPKSRYILVKGSWWDKPIGLRCTNDNYEKALSLVKEKCPSAAFFGI